MSQNIPNCCKYQSQYKFQDKPDCTGVDDKKNARSTNVINVGKLLKICRTILKLCRHFLFLSWTTNWRQQNKSPLSTEKVSQVRYPKEKFVTVKAAIKIKLAI
jgi:hypothetical protein